MKVFTELQFSDMIFFSYTKTTNPFKEQRNIYNSEITIV